ncbi:MAG: magnesium transporter [Candidatus Aenigmarchaeota archaeon]|nr:magnesium transporter [Candidatus Aenigmarchaeota archaeon]
MTRHKRISLKHKRTLAELKRKHHHPLVHHIHKKHRISYRTLFYMKEYGPRSHVSHVILRESIKILVLTSVLSSIGGLGIESIQEKFIAVLPLLILLPTVNGMIGNFGTIVSSKFTTSLYMREVRGYSRPFDPRWWKSGDLYNLLVMVLLVALICSVYVGVISSIIALARGYPLLISEVFRLIMVSVATTAVLVSIIFVVSVIGGIFIYRRGEDPNNFLIPITTSIADICSMLVLAGMALLLF